MQGTPNEVEQKPVFMPRVGSDSLVKTDMVTIERHVGFSSRQKKKTINDLHYAIRKKYGFKQVLELSSKSGNPLSFLLSTLSLKLTNEADGHQYSIENLFQSSKIFEQGGAYIDLLTVSPRQSSKDIRLRTSGMLIGYEYLGRRWNLQPLSAFYDWLYVNALNQTPELHQEVLQYQAFTDITFNPAKSIHCPAYSIAMFIALYKRGRLDNIEDVSTFYNLYSEFRVSNTEDLLEDDWF